MIRRLILDVSSRNRHVLPMHRRPIQVRMKILAHVLLQRVRLSHLQLADRLDHQKPLLTQHIPRIQQLLVFRVHSQPYVPVAIRFPQSRLHRPRHGDARINNCQPVLRRTKSSVIHVIPNRRVARVRMKRASRILCRPTARSRRTQGEHDRKQSHQKRFDHGATFSYE